ncbi:MAG: hypothetical protein QXP04_02800 [Candidatus Nanoarchaeia archaeon]|nr:hypothetical protein [Candidatus Jingweiarchaeum tengchongense]
MRGLEITTTGYCTNACKFCPQVAFQNAYQGIPLLKFSDFRKVLDDHVPKDVRIIFSGFSEPFLNPWTVDMIKYAYERGYRVELFTTLVGLSENAVDEFKNVRFHNVCLHLPDNLGNTKIPYENENYKNVLVKFLTSTRVDGVSIMNENFVGNNRAGLINLKFKPLHKKGILYCDKFRHPCPVMLPNCDVVLCCMDFGLKHKVGNLLEQNYEKIVENIKVLGRRLWKWDSEIICRECTWSSNPIISYTDRTARWVYRTLKLRRLKSLMR